MYVRNCQENSYPCSGDPVAIEILLFLIDIERCVYCCEKPYSFNDKG